MEGSNLKGVDGKKDIEWWGSGGGGGCWWLMGARRLLKGVSYDSTICTKLEDMAQSGF